LFYRFSKGSLAKISVVYYAFSMFQTSVDIKTKYALGLRAQIIH
jgi:hypothetical protein